MNAGITSFTKVTGTRGARGTGWFKARRRYLLITLVLLIAIYTLSSIPDTSDKQNRLEALLSNLAHAPLFAGVGFCLVKTISAGEAVSWRTRVGVLLVGGICAALDEWHQSFVPGRHASLNDFLLDLTGIVGMLLILHRSALREANR
jgi:VanZ family protein